MIINTEDYFQRFTKRRFTPYDTNGEKNEGSYIDSLAVTFYYEQ